MAATMILSFLTPTTKTPTPSISFSSSSPPFNCLQMSSRLDQFPLRSSTPTDSNRILSSSRVTEDQVTSSSSLDSGCNVVRSFYQGINSRNLSTVVDLIAHDCVYEDLVFPQPVVGRKAILEFFEKFIYTISQDLQFVIDDISGEDTSAVGVTWHLEWKGKPFPFSKGCSFYRLKVVDGRRQIIYGRDIVEPAVKPGDFALVAIRGVTWLLQQFPQLAERF